eukprot:jgi/Mesen1/10320/ME000079S09738
MFGTFVRFLAKEANTGATAELGPAVVMMKILKERGPLNKHECWELAEEAGMKSKRHMKLVLNWLKEKNQIRMECRHMEPGERPVAPVAQAGGKKKKKGAPPPEDKVFYYRVATRRPIAAASPPPGTPEA